MFSKCLNGLSISARRIAAPYEYFYNSHDFIIIWDSNSNAKENLYRVINWSSYCSLFHEMNMSLKHERGERNIAHTQRAPLLGGRGKEDWQLEPWNLESFRTAIRFIRSGIITIREKRTRYRLPSSLSEQVFRYNKRTKFIFIYLHFKTNAVTLYEKKTF